MMHFARAYLMLIYLSRPGANRESDDRLDIEAESRDLGLSIVAYRVVHWIGDAVGRVREAVSIERPSARLTLDSPAKLPGH